jgi:hypothetical protein
VRQCKVYKDPQNPAGAPVQDHTTSHPSANSIDWDMFPYEDTQGPLLSPVISGPIDSIPDLPAKPDSVIMTTTEALIDKDGFHINCWVAGDPDVLPPATHTLCDGIPSYFRDAAMQVSLATKGHLLHCLANGQGLSTQIIDNPAPLATPDIIMAVPTYSCNGTNMSSARLSVCPSEINTSSESDVKASSDLEEGTNMQEGTDM